MPTSDERKPYSGPRRKLLLAFDVGTTYSGISYSILDPGSKPEIHGVHKFPGQVSVGGDAKIPSIMYYDQSGRVRAVGAEAEREGIDIMAEEEKWVKTKWFKLHLRPKKMQFSSGSLTLPPLPLQKTVVEVLSDFLCYLNECAKQYIQEHHPGIGNDVWAKGSEIHYILPHPNGWEGPQRSLMKQAAENACLITGGGPNQLSFVTEGEASLNRCVEKGLINDSIRGWYLDFYSCSNCKALTICVQRLKRGEGMIMVDAGGGTIDMSVYALDPKSAGKWFEEIAQPQYIIKEKFDKKTKCGFRNPQDPYFVQFGTVRDRNPHLHIQAGKLRLEGKDITPFFEPSIDCIIQGVLAQRKSVLRRAVSSVFLVGGFSNNGYLFKRVKDTLEQYGLHVSRPDTLLNKAVADGAIAGVLDRPVRSRISRNAFGVECGIIYDSMLKDHVKRRSQCVEMLSGEMAIPNGFNLLLRKDTQVPETEEFRCSYTRGSRNSQELRVVEKQILCYHGSLSADKYKWMDNDRANYKVACTIRADLTGVPIPRCVNPRGQNYYKVDLDVILIFGATELMAKVAWKEKGREKRRDAEVIYNTEDIADEQGVRGLRLFNEGLSKVTRPNEKQNLFTGDEHIEDAWPRPWVTVGGTKKSGRDQNKKFVASAKPKNPRFIVDSNPWAEPDAEWSWDF
ncbi:hypothetical protein NP233_g5017 [Leucocoprinus birnbaumii]|uniref:Uncharacterized protein n=1 Tax=Leucocoprinus birnbaumii TaxID=56174 RepID=A0AAD5YRB7_9AGAR|nr:hypothetical protein NP233_g5017 [Leucocoprinus birnbaumii]